MRNNRFLKALGMEDIETDLPETTETPEEKPTRNITQEPVHNEQGADDKQVPGTGATVPGSSEIKADELNNTNRPNQDITGEHPCGDENAESEVVTEDQTEEPPYEGQGDAGEQGAENPEPMDTNSGTEEPSEITPGEGDNEDFPEESEGADGDTAADDAEVKENDEDTIIADVEVEEVEDVTEDEEEDAEDALDGVEEDEEKEEDEEEVLDKAEEEAEELTEANESWTIIMRSAVANNNVTPELKAGLEAHLIRVSNILGDNVAGDIASLEAFSDDHGLYCEQVVASLEGIGDTLERIGERITNAVSKRFHVVSDLLTQKKSYGKLKTMADAALNKIANSSENERQLKTGLATRALAMAGSLPTNIATAVATHTKNMESVFNDFIPKSLDNLKQIVVMANSAGFRKTDDVKAQIEALRKVPLASSYLKPEWVSGKAFLGCVAFRGGDNGHSVMNGSFARYCKSRHRAGTPHWHDLDDTPQRVKLTIKKADAQAALKTIRQHCANMEAAHGKIKSLEKQVDKEINKCLTVLGAVYPVHVAAAKLVNRPMRYRHEASKLALGEVGWFIAPSRRAIYNDIRALRGVIKFLSQF